MGAGLADLKRLRKAADAAASPPPAPSSPATLKAGKRKAKTKGGRPVMPPPPPPLLAAVAAPAPSALTDEDKALFRQAVKAVVPIRDTRRAILPPANFEADDVLQQRRERAMGREPAKLTQVSDHYTPVRTDGDDSSFLRPGHGSDLVKGLKRGKWPIEATLDLHGNTLEEARERLDRFLQSCLTHRIKCVRIVHGKGYGSKDGESVLKVTLRRWLTQLAAVQAYAECAEADGGSGAVQVLLRPDPDSQ